MSTRNNRSTALLLVLLCLLFASGHVTGQAPAQAPLPPATDTVAPSIPGVVAEGTKVKAIKEGFQGTEGPIALPDGSMIFTENLVSRLTRIDKDDNVSTFLEDTHGSMSLGFDAKGRLIAGELVPEHSKVGVIYPKGSETVLAENFGGRPNDLVVDRRGGVYFTVPNPDIQPGAPRPPEFAPAVYYIPPGGKEKKIAEGITFPNGIQLSPDEKTLYVSDTRGEYLLALDVQPDGTVANRRNFAKYEGVRKTEAGINSGADGMAVDSEGRVYCAAVTGVQVFSPKGDYLGNIPVSRPPQNLAFAGADKKTLYIVGRGAAYRVQMLSQGYKGRAK
jgi:gluconolactonase